MAGTVKRQAGVEWGKDCWRWGAGDEQLTARLGSGAWGLDLMREVGSQDPAIGLAKGRECELRTSRQVQIWVLLLSGCALLGCYTTSLCLSFLIIRWSPKWQVCCETSERSAPCGLVVGVVMEAGGGERPEVGRWPGECAGGL